MKTLHRNGANLLGTALVACLILNPAQAQQGSACGPQTYGKFTEWSAPVNLGPVVNSASGDQWPALSPDGLSLYFASGRAGGQGGQDLWVTRRASASEPWSEPVNLGPGINSDTRDNSPVISSDGHWLIFGSRRTEGRCFEDSTNEFFIAHRADIHDDFAWEVPINFGCEVNGPGENAGLAFFEDIATGTTTMYIASSRPGGPGPWDIWSSTRYFYGNFWPPAIVPELSSLRQDGSLAVRRDGLEMILTYDAEKVTVNSDLWVATRESTSQPWSAPVRLGPDINTADDENFPALSCDGTTLIFASNRPGGMGGADLYMSTRTRIEDPPAAVPAANQRKSLGANSLR